jgi:hypothetical protein
MFRANLIKSLLVFGCCTLIALFVGYHLASEDLYSYGLVLLLLVGLCIPILLKWDHVLLLLTWNSVLIVYFLPGEPAVGFGIAAMTVFFKVLWRSMSKKTSNFADRSTTMSLLFLTLVVFVTLELNGGIGGRALGAANWGGKRYVALFGGILGYFALTSKAIPTHRGRMWAGLFFLVGISAGLSDLIYALGPSFFFFFAFLRADYASSQALTQDALVRLTGVAFASFSIVVFMLVRYGFQQTMNARYWIRALVLMAAIAGTLVGGYRSMIIICALLFVCLFFTEGLWKTRYVPIFGVLLLILAVAVVMFSDKLPLSVQRSISFLPLKIDPLAQHDADGTLEWRLVIWKTLVPQIPNHLLLGKGFSFDGTDFQLTQEAMRRGIYIYNSYEDTLISGNYHSGILTLIIPFGIWGLIAFTWFCIASLRVLIRNLRHGERELLTVNRFLLAYFIARLIFYVIFYGQFDLDLAMFTGTVGLSLSLNHGVRGPKQATAAVPRSIPVPEQAPALALAQP